jgi:RNA polymerase sigma-70 factor (ECF subfamily)
VKGDYLYRQLEDEALVRLARLDNPHACDELVRRYRGAVILVAEQILCSREAAEDAAQETFLLAFRALSQLQEAAKFSGWLYTIARHRARRMRWRDRRTESVDQTRLDYLLQWRGGEFAAHPAEEAERNHRRASVRALLAEMPEESQTVLLLHYFEEWPVTRIAEFLSLPLTTVKWRMHQARKRLCRQLSRIAEEERDESVGQ